MNRKVLGIILLLVFLLTGGYFGYNHFNANTLTASSEDVNGAPETNKTTVEPEELKDIELDVPVDKVWEFSFPEALDEGLLNGISITDSEGAGVPITSELTDKGTRLLIKPPDGGYKKGSTYKLAIKKLKYTNGQPVTKPYDLEFIITRDEVEEIVENPNIIKVPGSVITENSGNAIKVSKKFSKKVKRDDILVLPSAENPEGRAVKVSEIDNGFRTATIYVTRPEFTELFNKLDIYKTYPIEAKHITVTAAQNVSIEGITAYSPNTMIASSNSAPEKKNEYSVPTVNVDTKKGFKVTVNDFEIATKKGSVLVDGTMNFLDPEILADVDMGFLKINRFNFVQKMQVDQDLTVRIKGSKFKKTGKKAWGMDNDGVGKDNKEEILLTEKAELGKMIIPTPIAGLFVKGTIYLGVKGTISGDPVAVISVEVDDQNGFVYQKKETTPISKRIFDFDFTALGKGEAEAKVGAFAGLGLSYLEIIGGGVEGFGGLKGEAKAAIGGDIDDLAFTCAEAKLQPVASMNVVVDTVGDIRLLEIQLAEKLFKPVLPFGSCEQVKGLDKLPEEINLKRSGTYELAIKQNLVNYLTMNEKTQEIDYKNLTFEVGDEETVKAEVTENSKGEKVLAITAPEFPKEKNTALKITYNAKNEFFGLSGNGSGDGFNNLELTEEIPVRIVDWIEPKPATAGEIKSFIESHYSKIFEILRIGSEKYNFALTYKNGYGNKPDYTKLQSRFQEIATPSFEESILKPLFSDNGYYCECDAEFLPWALHLNTRFKVLENRPDYFKIETVETEQELGGGYKIFIEGKKEDGNWRFENLQWAGYWKKPINLTKEEAASNLRENAQTGSVSFVAETAGKAYNPVGTGKIDTTYYIFKGSNGLIGIDKNSGKILYDVSEVYREPSQENETAMTAEEAIEAVREELGISPDSSTIIEYDHDEDGQYVIHVYDIIENEGEPGHTATRGWYLVNPETGTISDLF
ncbi:hypothetical protein [Pseudalkalibacillus caeni]|uniref:SbsA Ig-like domain-containing protein n=1 Tax=Exobacillus caeni TaxID=2574798 RepID=A0A5R9FDF4_9BACL|nr:hypothetical protein [Pseudalkalibacillus caeni]TLS38594.1 hypothetical protein FCL54_03590 [Pseudalkalibacillus caeni]